MIVVLCLDMDIQHTGMEQTIIINWTKQYCRFDNNCYMSTQLGTMQSILLPVSTCFTRGLEWCVCTLLGQCLLILLAYRSYLIAYMFLHRNSQMLSYTHSTIKRKTYMNTFANNMSMLNFQIILCHLLKFWNEPTQGIGISTFYCNLNGLLKKGQF